MTPEDALGELAASTAEAVAGILDGFLPGRIEIGRAEAVPTGTSPLEGVSVPAVAADAGYVGAASGGAIFVITTRGARELAAAFTGADPAPGSQPLDAPELSAFTQAVHQMMAGVASATAQVLGEDVELFEPEVRDVETVADAVALADGSPHATGVSLTVAGEPSRIVQLVPKAFVVRMTRALDDFVVSDFASGADAAEAADGTGDILRRVPLRVCAEIGRATMPMADAVGLPEGGLVELDRGADDPVDLMVNGQRFAIGRLVLVDDEWAVRIEEVLIDASELPFMSAAAIERS